MHGARPAGARLRTAKGDNVCRDVITHSRSGVLQANVFPLLC